MLGLVRFLANWRSLPPYELASYPLMFASVPMLAYGSRAFDAALFEIAGLTIVSLYAAFFAALIVNDVTDRDIDAIAHPDRPIPSGRVSVRRFVAVAIALLAACFAAATLISRWCLLVAVGATALAVLHNKYLKRRVRLPGYSEFFGSMQWLAVGVFGFVAVWSRAPGSAAVVLDNQLLGRLATSSQEVWTLLLVLAFIYFVDTWHDIPEGILDSAGDRLAGITTISASFGERAAARIALAMFLLSGVLGLALYFRTALSPFFLISFVALFLFTARYPIRLVRARDPVAMRAASSEAGRRGFDYFLFSFDLVFLDLLAQQAYRLARA